MYLFTHFFKFSFEGDNERRDVAAAGFVAESIYLAEHLLNQKIQTAARIGSIIGEEFVKLDKVAFETGYFFL